MILVLNSNGFAILLRNTSSWTLSVSLSFKENNRELSCASAVWRVATGRPVLSWVCSTLRLIVSSEATNRPVLFELSSSLKELTLISWERDSLPSCKSQVTPIARLQQLNSVDFNLSNWSRKRYERRRLGNKIHHQSRFCCDSFSSWILLWSFRHHINARKSSNGQH